MEDKKLKVKNTNQPATKEELRRLLLHVLDGLADDVRALKEAPPSQAEEREDIRGS